MPMVPAHTRRGNRYGTVLLALFLWAVTLSGAGCGSPDRFAVESLRIQRIGWDSLDVSVRFMQRSAVGGSAAVAPDLVNVTVFDERFDTLYAGPPGRVAIHDADLGNEERLLLEVCGLLGSLSSCDQEYLSASPKRALSDFEVTFPMDSTHGYERALITTGIALERKVFGRQGWEPFEPTSRYQRYVEAWVAGSPEAKLRLSIQRSVQRFILPRYNGYRDFRYAIQSSMLDTDSATVHFDLFVELANESLPVQSRQFVLRNKSSSEREAEMRTLVERAGQQILDRLERFPGVQRAYVFINDWSYTALDRVYKTEFELHWQAGFRGVWSDLTGEMQVRSDGELGTFTLIRASERATERWDEQVRTQVLELVHLFPDKQILPPDDPDRGHEFAPDSTLLEASREF